jgi:hypothetical protein
MMRGSRLRRVWLTAALVALGAAAEGVVPDDYRVEALSGGQELRVEARFAAAEGRLVIEDGLGPFVSGPEAEVGRRWQPLRPDGDTIALPRAATGRVRYLVRLGEAARSLKDRNRAIESGGLILAPPSSWLLRPVEADRPFRLRVSTTPPTRFATGLFLAEPEVYAGQPGDLAISPYSVFGPLAVDELRLPGWTVAVARVPGQMPLARDALLAWVRACAAGVAAYYGRPPVPRLLVTLLRGSRRPVGYGMTLGNGGASIVVWLGATQPEHLARDWVLTHEMVHLAFPNVPRRHFWLEEGIATYVEPMIRARDGRLTAAEMWRGLLDGLPRGLPQPGDGGLDGTRRWGRTYWGGALFCLLADIEIRERTSGRRSLDDALRAINAAGGSIAVRWDLARALAEGDRATGTDVLQRLHERLGPRPENVDLPALFARLGVRREGDTVSFDDRAPLAAHRRAMTARWRSLADRRDPELRPQSPHGVGTSAALDADRGAFEREDPGRALGALAQSRHGVRLPGLQGGARLGNGQHDRSHALAFDGHDHQLRAAQAGAGRKGKRDRLRACERGREESGRRRFEGGSRGRSGCRRARGAGQRGGGRSHGGRGRARSAVARRSQLLLQRIHVLAQHGHVVRHVVDPQQAHPGQDEQGEGQHAGDDELQHAGGPTPRS